jgi:hypothetical protein
MHCEVDARIEQFCVRLLLSVTGVIGFMVSFFIGVYLWMN